jgi:proteasome accessory factor C
MYERPGLWFNASELHVLLSVQQLLADIQPGLLDNHLRPLQKRIQGLLQTRYAGADAMLGRVRFLQAAGRPAGECFAVVAGALAQRRRLHLQYYSRGQDAASEREISPLGLTYYRDNWYLDAWCHWRDGLRTFSLDAIEAAEALAAPAVDVDEGQLQAHRGGAYGIFSGGAVATAVLRFTRERARWVVKERWHERQEGRLLADGRYELRVPYGNPSELIMDILKYGPDVEVLGPKALRRAVAQRLGLAARQYGPEDTGAPVGRC